MKTIIIEDESGCDTIRIAHKLIAMILIAICCSCGTADAQTLVKADGTTVSLKATSDSLIKNAVKDGSTYVDSKGNKYPVWRSAKGKLFIVRISGKTGNPYKQYLN